MKTEESPQNPTPSRGGGKRGGREAQEAGSGKDVPSGQSHRGLTLVVSNAAEEARLAEPGDEGQKSTKGGAVEPLERAEGRRESKLKGRLAKGRLFKRVLLGFGLLVFIGLSVATGVLVYHQARQKRVRQRMKKVRKMISLDTAVAYREASHVLGTLLEGQPDSAAIVLTRAEVEAIQWGRFDGGKRSRKLAQRYLNKALRLKASAEGQRVVSGYLLLYGKKYEAAAKAAETALVHHPRSARLEHILGVARLRLGDLEAAEATLRLALSHDDSFLPALYQLAVVQRLRGRLEESETFLQQILRISPRHLGAQIELALVHEMMEKDVDRVLADKLAERARGIPVYVARVSLLQGRLALDHGTDEKALVEARRHFQRAALLRAEEPEYLLELLSLHLRPGGDMAQAQLAAGGQLRRVREYPNAPLLQARLALGAGDPGEALGYLEDARLSSLELKQRARVVALRVHAHLENDRSSQANKICGQFLDAGGDIDGYLKQKGLPVGGGGAGSDQSRRKPTNGDSRSDDASKGGDVEGIDAKRRETQARAQSGETGETGETEGDVQDAEAVEEARREAKKQRIQSSLPVFEACARFAWEARDPSMAKRLARRVRPRKLRWLLRGVRYLVLNRPVRAWKSFNRLTLKKHLDFAHFYGRTLQALARPREALAYFKSKHEYEAKAVRQRFELALALFRAGRIDDAKAQLRKVGDAKPKAPRLIYDWGRLCLRMGDLSGTAQRAQKLIKDHPNSPFGPHLMGLIHLRKRHWNKSRGAFEQALKKSTGFHESTFSLACIALARTGSVQAQLLFQRAYRESGRDPDVLLEVARQYAEEAGERQMVKAYMAAARSYRRQGSGYRASQVYSELAERLAKKKKSNRARIEHLFKRALRYRSVHPLALFRWAKYLRRRGKAEEALPWYRRAAKSAAELPDLQYGYAWILMHLKKSPEAALAALRRFKTLEKGTPRSKRVEKMERRLRYRRKKERAAGN